MKKKELKLGKFNYNNELDDNSNNKSKVFI